MRSYKYYSVNKDVEPLFIVKQPYYSELHQLSFCNNNNINNNNKNKNKNNNKVVSIIGSKKKKSRVNNLNPISCCRQDAIQLVSYSRNQDLYV